MGKNKYCKACGQEVSPTKKFNWTFFLCTALLGIGIVYLIIFIFKRKNQCPICGSKL